jgi:hypothetical protein
MVDLIVGVRTGRQSIGRQLVDQASAHRRLDHATGGEVCGSPCRKSRSDQRFEPTQVVSFGLGGISAARVDEAMSIAASATAVRIVLINVTINVTSASLTCQLLRRGDLLGSHRSGGRVADSGGFIAGKIGSTHFESEPLARKHGGPNDEGLDGL